MAKKTSELKSCLDNMDISEAIVVQIFPTSYYVHCVACGWHHGCSHFGHIIDEIVNHTGVQVNTISLSKEELVPPRLS